MITLSTIFILYGLISLLRTYLASRKYGNPFNLGDAPTVYDFLGVLLLSSIIGGVIIIAILEYLP